MLAGSFTLSFQVLNFCALTCLQRFRLPPCRQRGTTMSRSRYSFISLRFLCTSIAAVPLRRRRTPLRATVLASRRPTRLASRRAAIRPPRVTTTRHQASRPACTRHQASPLACIRRRSNSLVRINLLVFRWWRLTRGEAYPSSLSMGLMSVATDSSSHGILLHFPLLIPIPHCCVYLYLCVRERERGEKEGERGMCTLFGMSVADAHDRRIRSCYGHLFLGPILQRSLVLVDGSDPILLLVVVLVHVSVHLVVPRALLGPIPGTSLRLPPATYAAPAVLYCFSCLVCCASPAAQTYPSGSQGIDLSVHCRADNNSATDITKV